MNFVSQLAIILSPLVAQAQEPAPVIALLVASVVVFGNRSGLSLTRACGFSLSLIMHWPWLQVSLLQ